MNSRKENIDNAVKRLRESIKTSKKFDLKTPDGYTQKEVDVYALQEKLVRIESLKQDIKQRKFYGIIVFSYLSIWSLALFILLFFQGFKIVFFSDKILITLLSVTTIKVLGLAYMVINYFFPKQ